MKFEQLEVWQKACRLSEALYLECKEVKDYGFKDQLTRAGLSVPSNIAEGMEREGIKEQIQFLNIARGSLAEVKTQMIIGKNIAYLSEAFVMFWLAECEAIAAMLGGLIKSKKQKI